MRLDNLRKFCIETYSKLWRMKMRSIVTCTEYPDRCTFENVKKLDGFRARFLKRCIGVAKTRINTLIFRMCNEPTMIEKLKIENLSYRKVERYK